jgi:molecular chaperone GrpE
MFKPKKEMEDKEKLKQEMDELQIPLTDTEEEENETEISEEDKLKKENDSLRDQLLRKAAEFENYKKRTENDFTALYKYANEGLIRELLPVLDDFERVIKSWNDEHDIEIFRKGIELVYDKFRKILEKQGLKEIESNGKHFDVNLHEALMQVPNEKIEPNTVTEVIEKGYKLKDKILRHAKVIVSAKPE